MSKTPIEIYEICIKDIHTIYFMEDYKDFINESLLNAYKDHMSTDDHNIITSMLDKIDASTDPKTIKDIITDVIEFTIDIVSTKDLAQSYYHSRKIKPNEKRMLMVKYFASRAMGQIMILNSISFAKINVIPPNHVCVSTGYEVHKKTLVKSDTGRIQRTLYHEVYPDDKDGGRNGTRILTSIKLDDVAIEYGKYYGISKYVIPTTVLQKKLLESCNFVYYVDVIKGIKENLSYETRGDKKCISVTELKSIYKQSITGFMHTYKSNTGRHEAKPYTLKQFYEDIGVTGESTGRVKVNGKDKRLNFKVFGGVYQEEKSIEENDTETSCEPTEDNIIPFSTSVTPTFDIPCITLYKGFKRKIYKMDLDRDSEDRKMMFY